MNAFCTVVTRSYLPHVRALADSLAASGNPEPLHVLVVDADKGGLPADESRLRFHGFDAVCADVPPLMRHYYDAFELCNALKPHLVSLLFQQGADHVVYLDSDLLVTGSFGPVWDGFGGASLQLTPHLLAPPELSDRHVNEIEIVDMGFLNGGFSAWRAGPASARMLEWLRSRLRVYGFCDRRRGMFVDQKLMPLLLQYYPDDVLVLRHPGLNVAFWNARERKVRETSPGHWTAGEVPVVFFHLSGYRLEHPGVPCSYLPAEVNAALLADSPWLAGVMAAYDQALRRHSAGHLRQPYPFGYFDGVKLTSEYRALLFATGALNRRSAAFQAIRLRNGLRRIKRQLLRFAGLFRRRAPVSSNS